MNNTSLPVADPIVSPETEPFWAGAGEGRLVLQHCLSCSVTVWYPRGLCPKCGSTDLEWREAGGLGAIYSYTIVRRGQGAFADAGPFVVAYVELDEGPRMLTNIVDVELDQVHIGQRVRAVFQPSASGSAIVRYRPEALGA